MLMAIQEPLLVVSQPTRLPLLAMHNHFN